jgi:HAD superfamily hydrolase (TIGR01490 family)
MAEVRNLVVFDFCETLVDFQTADCFVDFVIADRIKFIHHLLNFAIKILTKVRVISLINLINPKLNISKRLYLLKIRGVEEEVVNSKAISFLNTIIQNRYNCEVLHKLRMHKKVGDYIIISSGGYQPYLKLFSEKEEVDKLFCTQIEFKAGFATGKIIYADCMFDNKVKLLEEYLRHNKDIQFKNTIVYSDSITDLPLLKWANQAFVLSYNISQNWALKNNLNEIILFR